MIAKIFVYFQALVGSAVAKWNQFFFAPVSGLPIGVCRFFLGLNFFLIAVIRQVHWRFYFSDDGILQAEQAIRILPEFYQPVFLWYPHGVAATLLMHSLLVGALFMLTIGIGGRLVTALALFLHLAFLQRNFSIVYGADIIESFFLFALVFMDHSENFSLAAWWRSRQLAVFSEAQNSSSELIVVGGFLHEVSATLNTVGFRLLQLQLCIIYGYTGLEKLKGGAWWNGSALWTVFGNENMVMMDLSWLGQFPFVIGLMTFSAMLFEIYFPVLIWPKGTRPLAIVYGWLLHAMIGLTVGLYFFSGIMMAVYFTFISETWLARLFLGPVQSRAQIAAPSSWRRWVGPLRLRELKSSAMASATRIPSQAAEVIPPA
jgi:hypothetical protein